MQAEIKARFWHFTKFFNKWNSNSQSHFQDREPRIFPESLYELLKPSKVSTYCKSQTAYHQGKSYKKREGTET